MRVPESEVENLEAILRAFPPERVQQMQRVVRKLQNRWTYSTLWR